MFDRKKLIRLLKYHPKIPSQFDQISVGGKVKASELLDIYRRREETSFGKYKGFPEVIQMLKVEGENYVRVHPMEASAKSYFIFTDNKVKVIMGILVDD